MRRIIAISVMILILSGCSQKAAFEKLTDGLCSSEQERLVEAHISSQIDAIAQQDWKLAYSYASPGFRSGVEIEQFIYIISSQYQMLVENADYEFDACRIDNEKISQQVAVTSDRQVTKLTYILSLQEQRLGVDSATPYESEREA